MSKHAPKRHYSPDQLQLRATKAVARELAKKGHRVIWMNEYAKSRVADVISIKDGFGFAHSVTVGGKQTMKPDMAAAHLEHARLAIRASALAARTVYAGLMVTVKNPQNQNPEMTYYASSKVSTATQGTVSTTANDARIIGATTVNLEFDDAMDSCPNCNFELARSGICGNCS